MKKILAENIENLHEMLPFKYVSAFELNLCCTCTVGTDNGCRFIHLCSVIMFSPTPPSDYMLIMEESFIMYQSKDTVGSVN